MKIKWIGESQYSNTFGFLESGAIIDTVKRGIPLDVATNWIKDKWAKLVKPEKSLKEEK